MMVADLTDGVLDYSKEEFCEDICISVWIQETTLSSDLLMSCVLYSYIGADFLALCWSEKDPQNELLLVICRIRQCTLLQSFLIICLRETDRSLNFEVLIDLCNDVDVMKAGLVDLMVFGGKAERLNLVKIGFDDNWKAHCFTRKDCSMVMGWKAHCFTRKDCSMVMGFKIEYWCSVDYYRLVLNTDNGMYWMRFWWILNGPLKGFMIWIGFKVDCWNLNCLDPKLKAYDTIYAEDHQAESKISWIYQRLFKYKFSTWHCMALVPCIPWFSLHVDTIALNL